MMHPLLALRRWHNGYPTWQDVSEIEEPLSAESVVMVDVKEDYGSETLIRVGHVRPAATDWTEGKPWQSTEDGLRYSWRDLKGEMWVDSRGGVPIELILRRRLSRPCYDKYYRCPGRNGGGGHYAIVQRCDGGRLNDLYDRRLWKFRFNTCNVCRVVVLPYYVRVVDPTNWSVHNVKHWVLDVWEWKLKMIRYHLTKRWIKE